MNLIKKQGGLLLLAILLIVLMYQFPKSVVFFVRKDSFL